MESDPRVAPSIPADDIAYYGSRFVGAHPDMAFLHCKASREKFVKSSNGDFTFSNLAFGIQRE